MATALHLVVVRLARLGVPVVAAVQGAAAGAGVSLVSGADFVIAADTAKFRMAYTAIGLGVDGGSSYFLPRTAHRRRAPSERADAFEPCALGRESLRLGNRRAGRAGGGAGRRSGKIRGDARKRSDKGDGRCGASRSRGMGTRAWRRSSNARPPRSSARAPARTRRKGSARSRNIARRDSVASDVPLNRR